jgi:hypothetical protein
MVRRALGVLVLAFASGVLAAPAATPTWADWVGSWDARLKWSSCSADGEDRARLAVDAVDGVVSIDLSAAGGALGTLALVADETGWSGQQGDLKVSIKRPKADALELAIDLDSGCEIRGNLTRGSTGIAACDRLAAWARIESHCTRLSRPPLENPSRVAKQREQWVAARGEIRTRLAAQCTARSAKLETVLIDAGCAPSPDPEIGLRGAECQALRTTASRLNRCGNVPFDVRTALERQVVVLVAASQGADKAAVPVVEAECKQARDRLLAVGKQAGCPGH